MGSLSCTGHRCVTTGLGFRTGPSGSCEAEVCPMRSLLWCKRRPWHVSACSWWTASFASFVQRTFSEHILSFLLILARCKGSDLGSDDLSVNLGWSHLERSLAQRHLQRSPLQTRILSKVLSGHDFWGTIHPAHYASISDTSRNACVFR